MKMKHFLCAFLGAIFAVGYAVKEQPGTSGYRFVVAMAPEYTKSGKKADEIYVSLTPSDFRGALITTSCPRCASGSFVDSNTSVPYGESLKIELSYSSLSTSNRQLAVGVEDSVLIESSLSITVVLNYYVGNQELYIALLLPVQCLDNKYILSNFDKKGRLAVIAVAEGETTIYLQKSYTNKPLSCGGNQGGGQQKTTIAIQQYQAWSLQCDSLTGTFLYASKPVAVFVGNADDVSQQGTSTGSPTITATVLLEQVLPLSACGKRFVVPGKMNNSMASSFLRIVACYSNVIVTLEKKKFILPKMGNSLKSKVPEEGIFLECTVGCQVTMFTYSTSAHPNSMVNLIPVSLFTNFVTFSALDNKGGGGSIVLILILPSLDPEIILDSCHNRTCWDWAKAGTNSTSLEGWSVWYKTVSSDKAHTVFHKDANVMFGLYALRPGPGQGAITTAGFDLSPSQDCLTTIMVMDDGLDNDCDGNIDEEIANNEDDDLDGKVDEDLRSISTAPTVVNGSWGAWSAWDCWAPCNAVARYARYRLCDRPRPSSNEQDCQGNDVVYSNRICDYSNTPCFKMCPPRKWGPYCTKNCRRNCFPRHCDKVTGKCVGCKPGRQGDLCLMECPRFKFGAGCTQSCSDFCAADCDAETGTCDIKRSIMRMIFNSLAVGVIPAAFIFAGIYICRSQDPNRLALKRAIKSLNDYAIETKIIAKAKNINQRELRRWKHELGLEQAMKQQQEKEPGLLNFKEFTESLWGRLGSAITSFTEFNEFSSTETGEGSVV